MAMDDNPYAAPQTPIKVPVGLRSGRPEDVRPVAVYQKVIMMTILVYFGCAGLMVVLVNIAKIQLPPSAALAILSLLLIDILAGVVFVFLLAMKVYHPALGVFLALSTCIPLLGLLILLMVNGKATGILRANGYQVGFLGANLSQIPK